jgi:hypothetical protein
MNIDDCNLSNVDIHADPVEWVVAAYKNFLTAKLIAPLGADKTLCGEAGTEVVSVYKFRGDFTHVYAQLTAHLDSILAEIATEDLREKLIEYVYAHIQYTDSPRINPHYQAYLAAKRSGDLPEMTAAFNRYVEWNQRMHDNKQCLCFCNG